MPYTVDILNFSNIYVFSYIYLFLNTKELVIVRLSPINKGLFLINAGV